MHSDLAATPADAVFVDLDNTLIKGSAMFHLGRGFAATGLVSRSSIARLAATHAMFRLVGERDSMVAQSRTRGLDLAHGLPVEDVLGGAAELYDEVLAPRLWPGTLDLLAAHRRGGVPIWLTTAAPVELAQLIADRLGLSGALGTHAEQHNGVWTGRLAGPVLHGRAKMDAVADLAGCQGWDLARCIAYSDSVADLPLLAAVGFPTAVNPERRLRRIAESRGWPIHDFRARRWVLGRRTGRPPAPTGPSLVRHHPSGV